MILESNKSNCRKIVIIGGSGNGTVIASTIEDCKISGIDIQCVGFLNDDCDKIDSYNVLGKINDKDWKSLPRDYLFISAISTVKKSYKRRQLLLEMGIPPERFASIIHPTAVVSSNAKIGFGVVIMPLAVVSPGVVMDNHSQLYAQGFVGHHSHVCEMAFLAANSHTGGHVKVGVGAHVGIMSTSIERTVIGEYSVVGAGALVLKDVDPYNVVVGSPAKVIRVLDKPY